MALAAVCTGDADGETVSVGVVLSSDRCQRPVEASRVPTETDWFVAGSMTLISVDVKVTVNPASHRDPMERRDPQCRAGKTRAGSWRLQMLRVP